MTPQTVDLILSAAWILPIAPKPNPLPNCSLVIDDGKIIALVPSHHIANSYIAKEHIELGNKVLMPGLVNAHGHAAMSLLRGFADDLPLMRWLEDHIWPAEQQWVDADFVADGTQLAIAEMLKTGTTCFSDMYFFPEAAAEVVHKSGIRAQLAFPILDFPTPWAKDPDQAISQGLALRDAYSGHSRISIAFGPHAPYTVSDTVFERIAMLSAELDAPVQVHLHETQGEVDTALANHGERPIARLHQLGLLTPRTQCVHMTALNDDDIQLIAQNGASVVHCPKSNLKLASGLCPTQALLDAGITLGLGTDGAASNNGLDMFSELQTSALIGKITANNAEAISAFNALHMATLGSAKALGLDDQIGSLEVGKAADVIAIDLDSLDNLPHYNLASLLVYCQQGHNVSHVWVEGKCLLNNKQLTTLNLLTLQQNTRAWQDKIKGVYA
ncbi:MAG: TRZ/ATZ family hydrolase [Marinagarivorans sp.]|nr:TRZ/ATZ family hydrolase [Marinagarivorans sp.]